jgi:hypothetical protein
MKDVDKLIAGMVFEAAVEKVEDFVLTSEATSFRLSPADALKYLRQGLAEAAELAGELLPRNFDPAVIREYRRQVRRIIRRENEGR